VSQEVICILHSARSPQRRGIQRGAQSPAREAAPPFGDRNRALDQAPVELALDEPLAEVDQAPFGERRLVCTQAVEDQLPAAIHDHRLHRLVVGDTGVSLQDGRQRQSRRRYGRLAEPAVAVDRGKLLLEGLVEDLVAVLAQEDEELGALY
jgi:hypothetical protein